MAFKKKSKISMGRKNYKRSKINKMLPHIKAKAEKKYFDTAINVSAPSTGSITLVNGLGQNTTENARIGNRIDLKSVAYHVSLVSNSTPTDTPVRICLVYDKEADGALPAVQGASTSNAIFDNSLGGGTRAHLNLNNRDRYVILSDKMINMQHTTQLGVLGALNPLMIGIEKWKSLNTHTQYNAAGAGISTINSGALYFVVMSDQATGFNYEPLCQGVARVRYTDQ